MNGPKQYWPTPDEQPKFTDRDEQRYQKYVAYCKVLNTIPANRRTWTNENRKIAHFNNVNYDGPRARSEARR